MFTRITFVVLTNLLCWIPLCIASLVIWHFPRDFLRDGEQLFTAFIQLQMSTLFVVTFNSILNPYIYSSHLWKRLFKKITDKIRNAADFGSGS